MERLPSILQNKINQRIENHNLRQLKSLQNLIDFSSNDYLGFARDAVLFDEIHDFLKANQFDQNGSSGSRLITGNHPLYKILEDFLKTFHQTESASVFSSGFAANLGFFSCVPQKNDVILFDEYIHASIREGMRLSTAKSYKFKHNDTTDLERLLIKFTDNLLENAVIYVVTESVFSMDGDSPEFNDFIKLKNKYHFHLVVDEAHAVGVFGQNGQGLIQNLGFEKDIFARIITFSKAIGCHGGAILGSNDLTDYLINFARSFIYSTGLTPHTLATILLVYQKMSTDNQRIKQLKDNILYFQKQATLNQLNISLNESCIQTMIFSDANATKIKSQALMKNGFQILPILSPTVPTGKERIRLCLHAFNTHQEIENLIHHLKT